MILMLFPPLVSSMKLFDFNCTGFLKVITPLLISTNHFIIHIANKFNHLIDVLIYSYISVGKIIIETFSSIFQILDSPFNNAFLIA